MLKYAILALALLTSAPALGGQRWTKVEADDGGVYAIDLQSIHRYPSGTADALICYPVEHGQCSPPSMSTIIFDCDGHYMTASMMYPKYLPPKSVGAHIAKIVCG